MRRRNLHLTPAQTLNKYRFRSNANSSRQKIDMKYNFTYKESWTEHHATTIAHGMLPKGKEAQIIVERGHLYHNVRTKSQ